MKVIDGEELMDRVDFILSRVKTPEIVSVFQKLKIYLENAPTITIDDLRPKGRWVCLEPEIGYFACSECDHRILRAKCNFCPNCGADMRGGEG